MRGKVIEVYKRKYTKSDGSSFNKVKIKCNVDEDGTVKRRTASFSEEFAHKYFTFCGLKSSEELLGREVECVLSTETWTDKGGVEKTGTFIKFLNLIDDSGNAIIMPKENTSFEF